MAEIDSFSTTDASNTARWPEGMAFSAVNDAGRADEGILARWFQDTNGSLAASGSSNAFAVTSNRTISALTDGIRLSFQANHAITGAATLNLNGLGAKDIKRFNGSALSSGDIISGQPVDVIYSASLDDWIMISALAALVGSTHADFAENASPGDPAANTARLYARDDGAGVTELAWRDSAGTVSNLREATQTDMEAATSGRFVSPRRQHNHPGMPKVAGRGASAGGITGTAYNVTSITRNSTGIYTVEMAISFADTNYWVIPGVEAAAGDARAISWTLVDENTFQVRIFNAADADVRDEDFGFAVYGDL